MADVPSFEASPRWLSILVPAYKAEAHLHACVSSVVGQGVAGVEVIVLDDASGDATCAVADRLQAMHPQVVRVCRQAANRGISAARNRLLAEARGRHVWFLDADDLLMPGSLSSLKRWLEDADPDLVLCDFRTLREDFSLKHRLRGELHRSTFAGRSRVVSRDRNALVAGVLRNGQLHVWSKIARRSLWERIEFPEGRLFEDIAVMADLLSAARTHVHVPEVWVGYRQWPGSALKTLSSARSRDLLSALRRMRAGFGAMDGLDGRAWFGVDHFCLKSVMSLAGKLPAHDAVVQAEFRAAVTDMFGGRSDATVRAYLRRGWWMRALRARKVLAAYS